LDPQYFWLWELMFYQREIMFFFLAVKVTVDAKYTLHHASYS
jgi:hypothetical protein